MPVLTEQNEVAQKTSPTVSYLSPELLGARTDQERRVAQAAITLETSALKDKSDLQLFVRFRRAVAGKTQREVAKIIGVQSPEYLGMVENQKRMIETDKWPALGDALDVNRQEMVKLYMKIMHPEIYAAIWGADPVNLGKAREDMKFTHLPADMITFINRLGKLSAPQRKTLEDMVKHMTEGR